jgi:SAM-dependent methyltransferase
MEAPLLSPSPKREGPMLLEKLDKCLLCGSGDFLGLDRIITPKDAFKETLGIKPDETSWYMCQKCSFMFQNPRLERNYMKDWYARSGFREDRKEIPQGQIGWNQIQLARFEAYLFLNGIKIADMKGATCLDFGCGLGGAMQFLSDRGNTVWGVELDRREVEFGKQHYKTKFVHSIEEIPPETRFDFIFSHHALEHIFDPNDFLAFASRMLKPGGTIMIVIPSWRFANTMNMVHGFALSDNSMFDHVSLGGFFNKHGLHMYSYLYQNNNDWEMAALGRKSSKKNYFSFGLEETLAELYQNAPKRHAERVAEEEGSKGPLIVRM